MPKVQSAKISNRGRKRPNNEDFVESFEPTDPKVLQESGNLYIVADGVGGASKGERASKYAAGQLLYRYYRRPEVNPSERLQQIMARMNHEIFNAAEQKNTRMATTLVAAVVLGNNLIVANVGDSRAYLIRNGEAKQITRDHSLVGDMTRNGFMTEAEAQASDVKNRLTRSLGGESEVPVDIFRDIPLQARERILLCTDGLTRYALSEDISSLASQGSPDEIAQRLVSYANRRGGADNVSVILVAFESAEKEEAEAGLENVMPFLPSWDSMETLKGKEVEQEKEHQPESWETMDTLPGVGGNYGQMPVEINPSQRPPAKSKSWLPWVGLIGGVTLIAMVMIVGFSNVHPLGKSSPTPMQSLTPSGTATPSEEAQTPTPSTPTPPDTPTSTATATFTPAFEQSPDSVIGKVSVADNYFLNVRTGPGENYCTTGVRLYQGDEIVVVGISEDRYWVQIRQSNGFGWVKLMFTDLTPVKINPLKPVKAPLDVPKCTPTSTP